MWLRVAVLALAIIGAIALQAVAPQIVKTFIDSAIAGEDAGLMSLAGWFIVIAAVKQLLSVFSAYQAQVVGWTATNQLRSELAEHLLDLDMSFHKKHSPGELIERVDGDVTALSNFFGQFAIHIVGNVLLLVVVLGFVYRENAWIGLAMTLFAVIGLVVMLGIDHVATTWWKSVRAKRAEFYGFLGEQLGGTEDVRANGADRYMIRRFTELLRQWLPAEVKGRWGWSMLWGTNIVLFAVSNALVFWLGNRFLGDGSVTLGSVYLIYHYTEMLRHPIERIRTQMEDLQKANAGISRVRALLTLESDLGHGGVSQLPDGPLSLEFSNVDFTYEADDGGATDRVLHGVDFHIAPGRVVGVLGRTGSGKTTLARLIARLYDPESGRVELGGVAAFEAPRAQLRQRVGMVTQDVQLFRATIRENLTFFEPRVSDHELETALRELGLWEWVQQMPHGLDTMLGSGSSGLSAGEAQLVAFARVFLGDPGIVILDEASSRLDPATEQLIELAVGRLLENRTGVIIAHRLDTVNRADDILVMEDGRIAEFGERVVLAADPASRFAQLLEAGMQEVLR
ncbi:MAG: ABC transporter ATP-binding protein [Acidimicrobiia bacterium]|nr:ABC transporter ATP-binding protein [Acidimicrobiia bacterium]